MEDGWSGRRQDSSTSSLSFEEESLKACLPTCPAWLCMHARLTQCMQLLCLSYNILLPTYYNPSIFENMHALFLCFPIDSIPSGFPQDSLRIPSPPQKIRINSVWIQFQDYLIINYYWLDYSSPNRIQKDEKKVRWRR